jgi:hypothetical protein
MMPPDGAPHPSDGVRHGLASLLEETLDRAAIARPNPGRPLIHRLNRTEYANAVRDLLALDIDVASLLPPDDSAFGFDNIADSLGLSPVLLERYVNAASEIAAVAVGDPGIEPAAQTFTVRQDASQDVHVEGLPFGTVGGTLVPVTLPLDAEYIVSAKMFRTNLGVVRGLENEQQLEISVDGRRVHLAAFGGKDDFNRSLSNPTMAGDDVDSRLTVRLPLKAGRRSVGVAFLRKTASTPWRLQPYVRSSIDTLDTAGVPHLDRVTITGPFKASGPGDTPSRQRIFLCRPARPAAEDACARKIISALARRAYRGGETALDLQHLFDFYRDARRSGDFDRGIQAIVERVLASPKFAFRVERDPAEAASGAAYRLTDLEIASRLSFFLWSSIPDDELLEAARRRTLRDPQTLERQVRRMLADPKSEALVSSFADQWLYLRNLRNQVPNSLEFPDFDDNLRQAFQKEAELFFASVVREDRPVVDLMTADYTFVNERLARHYGIPYVSGSHFRRVTVTDESRKGLLGKGAILMVTSHTDRTSPVVRGKWILDNLLGAPPPPMPNDVPPFNENGVRNGRVLTMRERMDEHRRNPVCASCHKIMDPIGLSLENFDAVGAWRDRDGGAQGPAIDASGQLVDGTKLDGPVALRQALTRRPELFVGTVTEKLLTYALGRGLTPADMPAIRAIVRTSARQQYRFSSLLLGIVTSTPFQMRTKESS